MSSDDALVAQLLPASAGQPGSPDWWQVLTRIGAPLCMALADSRQRVTFVWRDPQGDERHSSIQQVLIDANGLTDHHRPDPQGLRRFPGTDLWHWSLSVPADWRGSYSFIALTAAQAAPPVNDDEQLARLTQRRWWRGVTTQALGDSLNPLAPRRNTWGAEYSCLQLPLAPDQSAWQALDRGLVAAPSAACWRQFDWHSAQLGNTRRVWLFSTAASLAWRMRRVGETFGTSRTLVAATDSNHPRLRFQWTRPCVRWCANARPGRAALASGHLR